MASKLRKLTLNKQTIRVLSTIALDDVHGGAGTSFGLNIDCPGGPTPPPGPRPGGQPSFGFGVTCPGGPAPRPAPPTPTPLPHTVGALGGPVCLL
jgi:hypothetical protein